MGTGGCPGVLYCTVLYCIVLCCTVLYCIVQARVQRDDEEGQEVSRYPVLTVFLSFIFIILMYFDNHAININAEKSINVCYCHILVFAAKVV